MADSDTTDDSTTEDRKDEGRKDEGGTDQEGQDNPRQNVTFPSNGNEAHGYLAVPESGSGPGLIVIQEWWGLVDHIVDVCDRFAKEGFVALAPDLYGGKTTHDAKEAEQLMGELPPEKGVQELAGAVDYLLDHEATTGDKVGTVGFCMGGGFVILMANQEKEKIGAAVAFYGVIPNTPDDLSGIACDVQGHFGEKDDFVPEDKAKALFDQIREQAGVNTDLHLYEGRGHAFFNDENAMGTYDKQAADEAWAATLEFLRSKLG